MRPSLSQLMLHDRGAVACAWLAAVCLSLWPGLPAFDHVTQDGEFRFLPESVPSRQAAGLLQSAFSRDILSSSLVIVVRRPGRETGLVTAGEDPRRNDFQFVEQVLRPRLEAALSQVSQGAALAGAPVEATVRFTGSGGPAASGGPPSPGWKIRTWSDDTIGHLLVSEDRRATLVLVELTSGFLDRVNWPLVRAVEQLAGPSSALRRHPDANLRVPPGLDLTLSGSATVGRDLALSVRRVARRFRLTAPVVTAVVLVLVTRMPLVAGAILLTGLTASHLAFSLATLLAAAGWLTLFTGIEMYLLIAVYPFCAAGGMAVVTSYRAALDGGARMNEAVAGSVREATPLVAGMCGVWLAAAGCMLAADFGKTARVGQALLITLPIAALACLTLMPTLCRLCGPLLQWPHVSRERIRSAAGWISPRHLLGQIAIRRWIQGHRRRQSHWLVRTPVWAGISAVAVLLVLASGTAALQGPLRYGFLSELSAGHPSVEGTRAAQEHFAAGSTSPVTLLLVNDGIDFSTTEGEGRIGRLSEALFNRREELGIADLRSVAVPFGLSPRAVAARQERHAERAKMSLGRRIIERRIRRKKITDTYVGDSSGSPDHVTRIDIVLQTDPFTRPSILRLDQIRLAVDGLLADCGLEGSSLEYFGATASLRDLQNVTDSDRRRLLWLMPAAVLVVLVLLLRKLPLALLLVTGLLLCCQSAIGLTAVLYQWILAGDASGLEWKLPTALLLLLLPTGCGFCLLLLQRVRPEQSLHGPVQGVTRALLHTADSVSATALLAVALGGLLLIGSLSGFRQLGLGLAIGALLASGVVRSLILPAWLILRHSGQLGELTRRPSRTPPAKVVAPVSQLPANHESAGAERGAD